MNKVIRQQKKKMSIASLNDDVALYKRKGSKVLEQIPEEETTEDTVVSEEEAAVEQDAFELLDFPQPPPYEEPVTASEGDCDMLCPVILLLSIAFAVTFSAIQYI